MFQSPHRVYLQELGWWSLNHSAQSPGPVLYQTWPRGAQTHDSNSCLTLYEINNHKVILKTPKRLVKQKGSSEQYLLYSQIFWVALNKAACTLATCWCIRKYNIISIIRIYITFCRIFPSVSLDSLYIYIQTCNWGLASKSFLGNHRRLPGYGTNWPQSRCMNSIQRLWGQFVQLDPVRPVAPWDM